MTFPIMTVLVVFVIDDMLIVVWWVLKLADFTGC